MGFEETITITKEIVQNFANLIGDYNPVHLDDEYARKSKFGKPIVHGMLLASFFSKIIATKYPGEGSIYVSQNIRFIKPCFVGDSITIKINLISIKDKKHILSTQILNSEGYVIVDGDASVLKD
jgi:acyl dehydratase